MHSPKHKSKLGLMLIHFVLLTLIVILFMNNIQFSLFSTAQEIALQFSNEIVMVNTLPNASVSLDDNLRNDIQKILNDAVSLPTSPLTITTYESFPHVIVTSNAWLVGTVTNAETQLTALNSVFAEWQTEGNNQLYNQLSERIAQNVEQRPNYISYTENCKFYDENVNAPQLDTCTRNITISVYSSVTSDGKTLQSVLCAILPTSCDLIFLYAPTPTTVRSPISGLMTPYTKIDFDIYSRDRNWLLVNFLNYANYTSALSLQEIAYIVIDGSEVFGLSNYTSSVIIGTVQECLPHYWYLIFLLILIFVIAIISHQCYYRGRLSGRRSARKAEAEIRAGQHMASMVHSNFSPLPAVAQFQYMPLNTVYTNPNQIIGTNNVYQQIGSYDAKNVMSYMSHDHGQQMHI